jgi:hypothetical protein
MRPLIHNNEYSVGEGTKLLGPIGAERPPLGSCVGPADARGGLGAGYGSGWKWDSICQRASDSYGLARSCGLTDHSATRATAPVRRLPCRSRRTRRSGFGSALLTPRHTGPDAPGACVFDPRTCRVPTARSFPPLAVHPREVTTSSLYAGPITLRHPISRRQAPSAPN